MAELHCLIDTKAVVSLKSNYEDSAWVEGLFPDLYFKPVRADKDIGEEHQVRTASIEGLIPEKLERSHNTFQRWGMGEINGIVDGKIFGEAFRNFDVQAAEIGLEYQKTTGNVTTHYRVDII